MGHVVPATGTAVTPKPRGGAVETPVLLRSPPEDEPMGTAATIDVSHEESGGRGAFFVQRADVRLAQMTYTRTAKDRVIIDHTEVDDALRGLGVARKLLDAAVAWARSSGTKVIATCPYAKAQFEKDESIRDVLA
jgi:uncharacterized protein